MAPSTHFAAVINRKGDVEVKKIAVPKAGEGEVLVKVVAAALNPTDWKSAKKSGCDFADEVEELTVSGCDFAGVVEELGPGLEAADIKVGDRVATCVPGARTPNGAFAEYVTAKARSCILVPESWTFEQGAQLPVAVFTTFQTLYQSHGLRIPLEVTSESIPLLVYGASTSVGLYVLQVAKASNFKTYALCSPKNFDLVKSFGADAVYDYRDPEAANKIRAASDGKIQAAIDTISEHGSAKIIVSALSSEGGKIATLLPYSEEDKAVLGSKYTEAFSLAYDVVVDRAGAPSRLGDTPGYVKLASQLLASGKVRPTPIRVWENGLEGINDAMQYMMDGKVSGEKIIFRIADTPGLA
ncbi:dehydrogenase [Peniophora sp. CONT]|nr:dehydrogenase [Peniophora sp. CONT]